MKNNKVGDKRKTYLKNQVVKWWKEKEEYALENKKTTKKNQMSKHIKEAFVKWEENKSDNFKQQNT